VARDLSKTLLYHITDVSNLALIVAGGGLLSDSGLATMNHQVIGYGNIKLRRMTEYRVPCCGNRFVGEFVPFYYCPRSPMLYTVNRGNTGRPAGCQVDIVHLVSSVSAALELNRPWAISDVNAGAGYAAFSNDLNALETLDWNAIQTHQWQGKMSAKQAEFLLLDRFEWSSISAIGCHNPNTAAQVSATLARYPGPHPRVLVENSWYY
jgi:ssDNA thymidine ADP-ribosyltransferase, DarT